MELNLSQITPTLSVGQEFKNYNDLCSVLQLKPTNGKSKRLQMQEIERFMSLERQGYKFIIKEIYPTPMPKKVKNNKRNSKYKDLIEYLLVQQFYALTRDGKNENVEIICWLNTLTYNLSMRNENFTRSFVRNPPLMEWLKDNDIEPAMCESFYNATRQILKSYVETALRSLERNYELGLKKEFLLIKNNNSRFLTEEESNWYRETMKEVIDSFNASSQEHFGKPRTDQKEYFTLRDIILHKKIKEFYDIMDEKVIDKFGSDCRIYEAYRISTTPKLIEYAKERVGSYEELFVGSVTLNGLICDGMKKSKFLSSQSKLTPEQRKALIDWMIAIDANDYEKHIDALLNGEGLRDALVIEEITKYFLWKEDQQS